MLNHIYPHLGHNLIHYKLDQKCIHMTERWSCPTLVGLYWGFGRNAPQKQQLPSYFINIRSTESSCDVEALQFLKQISWDGSPHADYRVYQRMNGWLVRAPTTPDAAVPRRHASAEAVIRSSDYPRVGALWSVSFLRLNISCKSASSYPPPGLSMIVPMYVPGIKMSFPRPHTCSDHV